MPERQDVASRRSAPRLTAGLGAVWPVSRLAALCRSVSYCVVGTRRSERKVMGSHLTLNNSDTRSLGTVTILEKSIVEM